jgi:hypothetical protein
MNKSTLKQLIREELKKALKEISNEDLDQYINGDYSNLYYFGGFESPNRRNTNFPPDKTTSIDIIPSEKNEVWENYIQADVTKPLNLPPKKAIFIPMGVISNSETLYRNINNLLKSKGVVVINEYVSFTKNLINNLIKKYNFKIIGEYVHGEQNPEYAEEGSEYEVEGIYDNITLQKP